MEILDETTKCLGAHYGHINQKTGKLVWQKYLALFTMKGEKVQNIVELDAECQYLVASPSEEFSPIDFKIIIEEEDTNMKVNVKETLYKKSLKDEYMQIRGRQEKSFDDRVQKRIQNSQLQIK